MENLNFSLLKKIYYPVALIFIIIMLISILSFNPMDTHRVNSQINALGGLGYAIASYFYLWFGYAFYFLILFFISFYISTFPKRFRIIKRPQIIGQLILLFAFTMLLSTFSPGSGGLIGGALRGVVEFALGRIGVYIIITLMMITSIASIIRFDLFSIDTYKILYSQFKHLFERIANKNKNNEPNKSDVAQNPETPEQQQNENKDHLDFKLPNTEQILSDNLNQSKSTYDTDKAVLFENYSAFEMENLAKDYLRNQDKTSLLVENPILSKSLDELKKKEFREHGLSVGEQQKNFDPYSEIYHLDKQGEEENQHTQPINKNLKEKNYKDELIKYDKVENDNIKTEYKIEKKKNYDLNFLESLNLKLQEQEATKDFNFIEKIIRNTSTTEQSRHSKTKVSINTLTEKYPKTNSHKEKEHNTATPYETQTKNDENISETTGLFNNLEETINNKIRETEKQKSSSDEENENFVDTDISNAGINDDENIDDAIDDDENIDDAIDDDETNNEDLELENCDDIENKEVSLVKPTQKRADKQITSQVNKETKAETQHTDKSKKHNEKDDKDVLSNILFEDAFEDDEQSYSNHPDLNEHFKHLRVSRFKEEDHTPETNLLIKKLEATLKEFKIEAKVTGVSRGPVITRFEIQPAPGIKLSKIVGLADNISLALSGVKIRIIAPIPGKSAVGIEVPNSTRDIVRLGDVFISDAFKYSEAHLPVVIGKEISGKIRVADLVHMPHLLVAGSTNSGKSVCINSIICSLLYSKSPEEVKFILVDPKIVELKVYNDLPHLLTPVITEPKKAAMALKWLVKEMLRRYKLLENYSSRNILNYNRKIRKLEKLNLATDETLDYIVLIIDEFADLMLVAKKEVEESVNRLAAMARAVGIHLILATQRPSTDVITGVIKSNFPARVGFRVSSIHDSRTILDKIGAEKLLGKGDMLFFTPGLGNPIRIQGTFITEEEIIRITDNLRKLGKPNYIDDIFEDDESEDNSDNSDDFDEPLYKDAIDIVVKDQKASASYLQRKLKIGYNRAARIVEQMELEGIVGPEQGSKPREVLI